MELRLQAWLQEPFLLSHFPSPSLPPTLPPSFSHFPFLSQPLPLYLGWSRTVYVAQVILEFALFLPQPLECRDQRFVPHPHRSPSGYFWLHFGNSRPGSMMSAELPSSWQQRSESFWSSGVQTGWGRDAAHRSPLWNGSERHIKR